MFKWLAKLLETSPEMEHPEGCSHDWQTVEKCSWLWASGWGGRFFYKEYYKKDGFHITYGYTGPYNATRRVCLVCGECIDEISLASDYIHAKWDEEDQRKELAAKMWEDCKGE